MLCSLLPGKLHSWLEIQLCVNKDKTPEPLAARSRPRYKWDAKIRNAHERVLLGVFRAERVALFRGFLSYSCSILFHHSARKYIHCLFTAFVIPNWLSKEVME